MLKFVQIFALFLLSPFALFAQITGSWKTIDDETGKEKSIVKIYEAQNGMYYGKISTLLDKDKGDNPICDVCPDDRKNKPVLNMVIIKELSKNGDTYSGGKILDPQKGKEYSCKIWREGENLKVRGYWGMFYRTQTWYKVK